jgi:hypothetical protein
MAVVKHAPLKLANLEIDGDALTLKLVDQAEDEVLTFCLTRKDVLDAWKKISPLQSRLIAWALGGK